MPNPQPAYTPAPIDTGHVTLSPEVLELTEKFAEHNHDIWTQQRLSEGWTYGKKCDDDKKQNPGLVPYADLPDSEKQCDRNAALDTM